MMQVQNLSPHAGGCGVRNRVQHCLVSQPPKVFTMQLAWQTDNESKQDIKAAMLGIREVQCSKQLALPCQLSHVLGHAWLHALQSCCACIIVLCSSRGS